MSTPREPTAAGMAVRTAVILFIFVVVFTGLLAGAYLGTKPAIEASAAEEKMKLIAEVLPAGSYDNDLLSDTLRLPPTPELGLDEASTVYRARLGKAPAAVVLEAVAPDGYAGKIRLLLAIHADGRIAGVRVTQHKETPGLGDYIEPKKDKVKTRPWISQFTDQSFATVAERDWKVKKDGGQFDYYAGATISPRAITRAVGKALKYANEHRDQLYAASQAPLPSRERGW
ncbi:MAG TPA: electron transport complex subunit RsxG, partial [Rhodocyclaceae bacterium]|nr:electron transport complex subunit RsxG [Rhodocyclaceae bacterium]